MSINISVKVDFTEFDKMASRLEASLNERVLNSLASRVARVQVMNKYPERFKAQVDSNSIWQKDKKAVSLPMGSEPGFLTGTTFRSISTEASIEQGRVFVRGQWPKRSGDTEYFKWDSAGLEYESSRGFSRFFESEPLDDKVYGDPEDPIEWMYLDTEDIARIRMNMEKHVSAAITGQPFTAETIYKKAVKEE